MEPPGPRQQRDFQDRLLRDLTRNAANAKNTKQQRDVRGTKSWSFKKISDTDKFLATLTKVRRLKLLKSGMKARTVLPTLQK